MGKLDKATKRLEEYPDVAADIVNALVYHGCQVISEKHVKVEPVTGWFTDSEGELRERIRDLLILDERNGVGYAYYGVENQAGIDNTMPVRVIMMDMLGYQKQIDQYKNQNRVSGDEAYGRQIHSWQKLLPVVTIVLYYGKDWDGPRSLWDMLDPTAREELGDKIRNYQIDIIELGRDNNLYELFQSDFQVIAEYMATPKRKANWKEEAKSFHKRLRHPMETLEMLSALGGSKRYNQIQEEMQRLIENGEGEDIDMCWMFDEMEEKGRAEGRTEGRAVKYTP